MRSDKSHSQAKALMFGKLKAFQPGARGFLQEITRFLPRGNWPDFPHVDHDGISGDEVN